MRVNLHCSASKFGNSCLIDRWHLERWRSGIGYHIVILNGWLTNTCYNRLFDGLIETGRPFDDDQLLDPWEHGAHIRGHNDTIGICLIGDSGAFTDNQMKSLYDVLAWLHDLYGALKIGQHSDFDPSKPHCAGISKLDMENLNAHFGVENLKKKA